MALRRRLGPLRRTLCGAVFLSTWATPSAACTICIELPRETIVDRVLAAQDVVFARQDQANPFRFAPQQVLKGTGAGDPIPYLVDAATRRYFAADPEAATLLVRRSGNWERLRTVDRATRSVLESVVRDSQGWRGPSGPARRFKMFADVHDHPSRALRRLALEEIARAPRRLVRTLILRLPRQELRQAIGIASEAPWAGVRIRLLAVAPEPADLRLIRDRFDRMARSGSSVHLQPLAEARIEVDGSSGLRDLRQLYGRGAVRTREERRAVGRALAIHATDGDPSLRPQIVVALRELLAVEPWVAATAAAVGWQLAASEREALTRDLQDLLAADLVTDPADRFAVASFLMMARRAGPAGDPAATGRPFVVERTSVVAAGGGFAIIAGALLWRRARRSGARRFRA